MHKGGAMEFVIYLEASTSVVDDDVGDGLDLLAMKSLNQLSQVSLCAVVAVEVVKVARKVPWKLMKICWSECTSGFKYCRLHKVSANLRKPAGNDKQLWL